jgi:hypothetical protein
MLSVILGDCSCLRCGAFGGCSGPVLLDWWSLCCCLFRLAVMQWTEWPALLCSAGRLVLCLLEGCGPYLARVRYSAVCRGDGRRAAVGLGLAA